MKQDKLEHYQHIHPIYPYISMERIEGYEPSDQGSNPCRDAKCTLSQVVWQLTFNQRINGSIPLECTKKWGRLDYSVLKDLGSHYLMV